MATYVNSDGLYIRTGQDQGTIGKGGEYNVGGSRHWVEINIDLTALGTGAAIQDNFCIVPAGVRIEEVEVVSKTAGTSGGSAVLNVGLIRLDRSTAIDVDGLIAALPVASTTPAGETFSWTAGVTAGTVAAAALIGTTTVYPGLITADYDTAAFTAGEVIVRVYWVRL